MLVIKYWAKKNAVCKTPNAISSYGWSLFFIAYLQSLRLPTGEHLVPTVHQVQQQTSPQDQQNILRHRVDFNPPKKWIVLSDDVAFSRLGLLAGFFKYYAEFPFGAKVVNPFSGEPVDIKSSIETLSGPDRLTKARKLCVEKFKVSHRAIIRLSPEQ